MKRRRRPCPHLPAQRKSPTKHPSYTQTKDQAFVLSMARSHKRTDRQINRLELYFSSTCFLSRMQITALLKACVIFDIAACWLSQMVV